MGISFLTLVKIVLNYINLKIIFSKPVNLRKKIDHTFGDREKKGIDLNYRIVCMNIEVKVGYGMWEEY